MSLSSQKFKKLFTNSDSFASFKNSNYDKSTAQQTLSLSLAMKTTEFKNDLQLESQTLESELKNFGRRKKKLTIDFIKKPNSQNSLNN